MAKYSSFLYSTAKYGEAALLAYSVEPMSIVVLDYDRVYIVWQNPKGDFSKIRVVRNQIGFPETSEDGAIVYEEIAVDGTLSRQDFTDGEDNPASTPLLSGRPVYYSVFLFTGENVWTRAGNIADVVPLNHGTQKNFIDIIPRVYTSDIHSQLGVVDEDSQLYKFVEGLTFTIDQLKTQIDLLRPKHTIDITSHLLLLNENFSFGMLPEPNISTKNQKVLARETLYLYAHRGLKNGVETFVESLTGYAPTITVSPNLLLSPQDSTFYTSVGNWVATNATLTASQDETAATGDNVIDTTYSGKIVATGSGDITLGGSDPIRKGVPVNEDTEYILSCQVKSPASAGDMTLYVTWYDMNAEELSTVNSDPVSANNSWQELSMTKTPPAGTSYAVLKIEFSDSGTYYVDQVTVQSSEFAAYDEARAVDIFLSPNKTNFINNPSFEVNVTDSWTLDGSATAAQDTDIPENTYSGSNSVKIIATDAWTFTSNAMPVEGGSYFVGSGVAKTDADFNVGVISLDSLGNVIETMPSLNLGTFTNWSQFQLVDLVDSENPDIASYKLQFSGTAGTFYIDNVQFEKGVRLSEYFDGTLPADFGAVWEGTPHNSYTRLYVGKTFKIPRLAQTLPDWMPPNSFWRIRTYDGVEYTNLTTV